MTAEAAHIGDVSKTQNITPWHRIQSQMPSGPCRYSLRSTARWQAHQALPLQQPMQADMAAEARTCWDMPRTGVGCLREQHGVVFGCGSSSIHYCNRCSSLHCAVAYVCAPQLLPQRSSCLGSCCCSLCACSGRTVALLLRLVCLGAELL